jgi:ribosomal protein S18 acetylase RimI-like enzyme
MIKIREAIPVDLPLIAEFQVAMAKETENLQLDLDTVQWGVNKIFYDKSAGKYIVAEKDNKIIASLLTLYEWSDWRNGQVIWIHSVYVHPDNRKEGVYKSMYDHLKNIVEKSDNFKGLRLYVEKSNTTARKVYESLGMNGDHYVLYEWLK